MIFFNLKAFNKLFIVSIFGNFDGFCLLNITKKENEKKFCQLKKYLEGYL